MKILGIDLSLTCPCVCAFEGDELNLSQCEFFYYTDKKKLVIQNHPIYATLASDYNSNMERYHNLSYWIIDIVNQKEPDHIFIEDYSFASTGRVFNIAENCGILKYNLWLKRITFTTIPPTVVKKEATGKGNSNKVAMELAFKDQTGFNIRDHLNLPMSATNPVSDIVDSYYIIKAGLNYRLSS